MSGGSPGLTFSVGAARGRSLPYAFDLLELDGTDLRREPIG